MAVGFSSGFERQRYGYMALLSFHACGDLLDEWWRVSVNVDSLIRYTSVGSLSINTTFLLLQVYDSYQAIKQMVFSNKELQGAISRGFGCGVGVNGGWSISSLYYKGRETIDIGHRC